MPKNELQSIDFDWRLTRFEGARSEQLRRLANLPLEDILMAIEEMNDMAQLLGALPSDGHGKTGKNSSRLQHVV